MQSVVQVNLLETVPIRERSARQINRYLGHRLAARVEGSTAANTATSTVAATAAAAIVATATSTALVPCDCSFIVGRKNDTMTGVGYDTTYLMGVGGRVTNTD